MPVRTIRYRDIAGALKTRLGNGEFTAGGLLPSEAELSASYEASRVTIRKALELLRDEGLVESRQGFGWLAVSRPLRQTLSRLGTIEDQLAASGVTAERQVLSFAFVRAPESVAEVLGGEEVLQVQRLNIADGRPFAKVTVWCPAELASEMSRGDVERQPFLELLDVELNGARQVIGAASASSEDAEALDIPKGSPVLRAERVTYGVGGRPVLMAEHIFPAHMTHFVVDLPADETQESAVGLRWLS